MPVWHRFKGMVPGVSPAHLPPAFAQEAIDCFIGKGDALYPERKPLRIDASFVNPDGTPFTGTPRQMWKSGDVYVAWDRWVHVISDPRAWGSRNAFLYVDQGRIWRASDEWIKQGKPPQAIGIQRPDKAPEAVVGDPGTASFSAPPAHLPTNSTGTPATCPAGAQPGEARAYVVCAVNDMQEESAPSYPCDVLHVQPEGAVSLKYTGTVPEGTASYRWYRTIPGKHLSEYMFVAETTLPVFYDTLDALQLSDPLETREHFPPMDNIEGITCLGSQDILVWSGRTVWPSVSRLPHAFAPAARYDLDYEVVTARSVTGVVSMGPTGTPPSAYNAFVLTTRQPYLVLPSPPDGDNHPSITSRVHSINIDEPCVGAHCAAAGEGCVFYSSSRGIIQLSLGERPVGETDEIFTLRAWEGWNAASYTLAYFQGRLFGFADDQTFILAASHIDRDRIYSLSYSTVRATAAYTDRTPYLLLSQQDRTILAWGQGNGNFQATWTSRLVTMPEYFNPGALKVDMDLPLTASSLARKAMAEFKASGQTVDQFLADHPEYENARDYLEYSLAPAVISVYKEKRPWVTKSIVSRVPHRLPRQGKGIYWHFSIRTDRPVYRVSLTKAIRDMARYTENMEEG